MTTLSRASRKVVWDQQKVMGPHTMAHLVQSWKAFCSDNDFFVGADGDSVAHIGLSQGNRNRWNKLAVAVG